MNRKGISPQLFQSCPLYFRQQFSAGGNERRSGVAVKSLTLIPNRNKNILPSSTVGRLPTPLAIRQILEFLEKTFLYPPNKSFFDETIDFISNLTKEIESNRSLRPMEIHDIENVNEIWNVMEKLHLRLKSLRNYRQRRQFLLSDMEKQKLQSLVEQSMNILSMKPSTPNKSLRQKRNREQQDVVEISSSSQALSCIAPSHPPRSFSLASENTLTTTAITTTSSTTTRLHEMTADILQIVKEQKLHATIAIFQISPS